MRFLNALLLLSAAGLSLFFLFPPEIVGQCQSPDCKAHNRWCYDTGTMEGWVGYRYYEDTQRVNTINVAFDSSDSTGLRAQTDDEGSGIELDLVYWKRYPECAKDCIIGAQLTTGSPSGNFTEGDSNQDTKCSGP